MASFDLKKPADPDSVAPRDMSGDSFPNGCPEGLGLLVWLGQLRVMNRAAGHRNSVFPSPWIRRDPSGGSSLSHCWARAPMAQVFARSTHSWAAMWLLSSLGRAC